MFLKIVMGLALLVCLQLRPPDVIIKGVEDEDYLRRWWLIHPKSFWGVNVYLHNFVSSDDARALHDHPWWSLDMILRGSYTEITEEGSTIHGSFSPVYREANYKHRIELHDGEVWTLFLTGPKVREWGFWCSKGFVHHKLFKLFACDAIILL